MTNRGGARPGAGRKKKKSSKRPLFNFHVSETLAEKIDRHRLPGDSKSDCIGRLLKRLMQSDQPSSATPPAEHRNIFCSARLYPGVADWVNEQMQEMAENLQATMNILLARAVELPLVEPIRSPDEAYEELKTFGENSVVPITEAMQLLRGRSSSRAAKRLLYELHLQGLIRLHHLSLNQSVAIVQIAWTPYTHLSVNNKFPIVPTSALPSFLKTATEGDFPINVSWKGRVLSFMLPEAAARAIGVKNLQKINRIHRHALADASKKMREHGGNGAWVHLSTGIKVAWLPIDD